MTISIAGIAGAAQMRRRSLLLGGLSLSAATALGTFGAIGQTVPNVRFSTFGNAEKVKIRGQAIEKFAETHPEINVVFEGVPSDAWPDKIAAMIAGGTAPDVITLGSGDVVEYASRGALYPLDEFIPPFRAELFDKSVLDLSRMDGKLYGIPVAVSAQGLGYNQSALQRLGMSEPPAAWTYDEFAAFCADVHKADSNVYGSHDSGGLLFALQLWLISAGKQFYTDDGKLSVTADDVAGWLNYWDTMRKAGGVVPADLQAQFTSTEWPNSPLVKGTAVFALMATNDLAGGYQALTQDTLGIMAPPSRTAGGNNGVYPQPTSSLTLNAKCENKVAAVTVMDWFVNDPAAAQIIGLISGPPGSKSALQAVLEMTSLTDVEKRILKYAQTALATAVPAPPARAASKPMQDLLRRVNESVGFGVASVQDAASEFVTEGATIIERA